MTSSDENQKASAEVNPDGGGAPTDSGARGSSVTADSNDKAIGDPLTKEESEGKPVASGGDPQQQNAPTKQESEPEPEPKPKPEPKPEPKPKPEPEPEPEPYPEPKEVPHDNLRDIWKASVDEALKAIEEREPGWTAEKERADKEEKERADKEEKERADKEEKERADKEEKERADKEEKERAKKEEKERAKKEEKERAKKEEKERAKKEEKERANHGPGAIPWILTPLTSLFGSEPKVGTPDDKLHELVAFYQKAIKSDDKIDVEEEKQLESLIENYKDAHKAFLEKNPVHDKEQLDKDLKKVVWTDEGTPPLNREQADDLLKRIDLPPIEPAIDGVETGSEPELVNLEHLFYKWYRAKAPQDDKISLFKDYNKRRLDYLQTHPGHKAKLDQMEDKVKRPIYTPPPVSETETKNTESEAETEGLDQVTPTADATESASEPVKVSPLTLEAAGESVAIHVKTVVSKSIVTRFGEDAKFWSEPQFTLEKTDAGWSVSHHARAKHETLLNGKAVTGSQPVTDGDQLAVGNEAKEIVRLPLKVRIGTP